MAFKIQSVDEYEIARGRFESAVDATELENLALDKSETCCTHILRFFFGPEFA